ncbi:MAG: glycosyltransferase, partial [Anaerolineae bacterium]
SENFERITLIPPLSSEKLANELKKHHLYIFASQNESCSNALIEGLCCGLPALCLDDGSNSEVLSFGGLLFRDKSEAMSQLDKLAAHLPLFQSLITVSPLARVIDVYEALIAQVLEA